MSLSCAILRLVLFQLVIFLFRILCSLKTSSTITWALGFKLLKWLEQPANMTSEWHFGLEKWEAFTKALPVFWHGVESNCFTTVPRLHDINKCFLKSYNTSISWYFLVLVANSMTFGFCTYSSWNLIRYNDIKWNTYIYINMVWACYLSAFAWVCRVV